MRNGAYITYRVKQKPTGLEKSPPLTQTPSYVDVFPLIFVTLDIQNQLEIGFQSSQNFEAAIKGWTSNKCPGIKSSQAPPPVPG